jgi:hypothetical protein
MVNETIKVSTTGVSCTGLRCATVRCTVGAMNVSLLLFQCAERLSRRPDLAASVIIAAALAGPATGAVFPPDASSKDVPALLEATRFVRSLGERDLVRLVPEQSGLRFVGCPNCNGGRQEGQLVWMHERPNEVSCSYCNHRYPSDKYRMDKTVEVRSPGGGTHRYPYWEDAKGYRYFFEARRDFLVREYLASCVRDLALLYAVTGDKQHARRAAVILDRFAQVFPGWTYHYDYPFQQKEIYDGQVPPEKFRPGFRTARWSWWAYLDVPTPMVQAYDWIRDSGELAPEQAARIERNLFRNAAEQVLANPETYGNMSPTAWRSLIVLGRVIGEPAYIEEPVRRLRRFVDTRFFYDSTWPEGAPSYFIQTVGGLNRVLELVGGQTKTDIQPASNAIRMAESQLMKMRLPDGRLVPMHDTWSYSRREPLRETQPYLLPALGHACLGGGAGDAQTQAHLTWSGGYGHQHADNLSLLLFAHGREMLSDLGYTHTAYRSWTLATAAHNTVTIDGENQASGGRDAGPTDGTLRWFDARNRRVQVVSAEGNRAYPGKAKVYRRTVVAIDAGQNRRYFVDVFEVEGGRTHDYFLHGDADAPAVVETEVKLEPLASLLPGGFEWTPTRNEGEAARSREPHYAYGFVRRLRASAAPAGIPLELRFRPGSVPGPALRVTLWPQRASRLVLGENPSIRGAREDDAKLEEFQRPFVMLRSEPEDGRSKFAAVLEPHTGSPFLSRIERLASPGATLALRVQVEDRTDLIVYGAAQPLSVGNARFQGEIGVLSMRGGKVEHAYALGEGSWNWGEFQLSTGPVQRAQVKQVSGDGFLLEGTPGWLPQRDSVARLMTPDGWVYPYTVVAAEQEGNGVRLRVKEGPGITFDAVRRRLELIAYPQRVHEGVPRIEWTPTAAR